MAFIHPQSCECVKSELDLFAVPQTQTSIETGAWIQYNPVTALAHGVPIEFNILGTGQEYFDLANTLLYVSAKIIKADGTDIDNTNAVGPVNLTLHSMFSEIDIKLNDTMITTTNNTYAYRAYLETLVSFGSEAKASQLRSAMYYKDTANAMAEGNPHDANARNIGLKARHALFANSHTVEMIGKIHGDLFFTDRYLPSDCSLHIRLVKNKDAFCLMSDEQNPSYKLQIISCKIYVRKVKISPSVFMAHAKALEVGNMKYPIRRAICKTFTVPSHLLNVTQENLFTGQLPVRIVVGFVNNQGFNGSYRHNPFNFHHYNLSQLKLYIDGQQGYIAPIEPDYAANNYLMAYLSLFAGTGKLFKDEGLDIAPEDYPRGYSLYAFDLTPDLGEQDHVSLIKEGNLRLEARFRTQLPHTVNVVVYAEFENIIEIDRNKHVIFNYAN